MATKAPKMPSLPARIYVKEENDGDSFYLVADRDRDSLVEIEPNVIGEYALVNTAMVKLVPQVV
jgi:hypothetical protein